MQNNLSETQPTSSPTPRNKKPIKNWLWAIIKIVILGGAITLGSLGGYYSAQGTIKSQHIAQAESQLQTQFDLAVQDMESGRFEVAKQRFEFIISIDPNYPGVMDMLARSMQVLISTATPSPVPLEATATPTRDPRPIEELYNQSLTHFASQEWDAAIDTLGALRKEDRTYQSPRVDGMLYLSLRSRGVYKILQGRQLEGGIYDLAQAARFGPLDIDANQARQWARLYIIGLSFWEVHPEQAVYYFSQVAAAVPNLTDASGWTANDRYRAALIQYGDQLAKQSSWCDAQVQYELAMSIRPDAALQETLTQVAEHCMSLTITPTLEATQTLTTTLTAPVITGTSTPTLPNLPTATPTATSPGATQPPISRTPTPTLPSTNQGPTPSATPTQVIQPTNTPEAQNTPYPSSLELNTQPLTVGSWIPNSIAVVSTNWRDTTLSSWWQSIFQEFNQW